MLYKLVSCALICFYIMVLLTFVVKGTWALRGSLFLVKNINILSSPPTRVYWTVSFTNIYKQLDTSHTERKFIRLVVHIKTLENLFSIMIYLDGVTRWRTIYFNTNIPYNSTLHNVMYLKIETFEILQWLKVNNSGKK